MNELPKRKNKHNVLGILLFVLLNVAIIACTAYSEIKKGGGNIQNIFEIEIHWFYLLPALLCFALAVSAEVFKYMIVTKAMNGKAKNIAAYKVCILGKYYDYITPSGIGGQPYQIYYLKKNGLSSGTSFAIPATGFISMQFAFGIVALVVIFTCGNLIESVAVRIAALVGLFFYLLFPLLILIFTFAPNFSKKSVVWFNKIGEKLHIVKDCEDRTEQSIRTLEEYRESVLSVIKKKGLATFALLLSVVYHVAIYSVPYFVIHMFGGSMPYITALATTIFIYASIAFIPTPGNAGAAEGSFYALFSMLTSGNVFWAMLVWRIICYYSFIAWGIIIYAVEFVKEMFASHCEKRKQ